MIPVSEPVLGARELEYVTDCLRTGWVSSSGRFIAAFEERWAAYCGRRYGVAVSSGTAALQVAMGCLDLAPGDEVILPTFTIISSALAVFYAGGVPVLVDSDPRYWTMDITQAAERITSRTRAIMPVHIYGHPVDMDPLLALAERHGLAVIEDAAEAHGAEYGSGVGWRRCGSFGTLSCFSFYANKLVTTGEGGMVVTDDPGLAERARSLRNLCFQSQRRFYHEDLGHNFRLTNLQAALGLAQIERIEEIVAKKRGIGASYTARLGNIPGLELQEQAPWGRSIYWMYGVVLGEQAGLDAASFADRLKARGVDTRPFFLGLHEQPAFHRRGLFRGSRHPVAERLARRGCYLPSGVGLSAAQLEAVCAAVKEQLV